MRRMFRHFSTGVFVVLVVWAAVQAGVLRPLPSPGLWAWASGAVASTHARGLSLPRDPDVPLFPLMPMPSDTPKSDTPLSFQSDNLTEVGKPSMPDTASPNPVGDPEADPEYPGLVVVVKLAVPHRVSAAFVVLCRNSDLYELLESIQLVQDRFNREYKYDWVFLNDEPFTEEFISTIGDFVPYGKLSFGLIPSHQWLYPEFVDQELAAQRRQQLAQQDVVYATSESYRFMCRYFLGYFYKHPLVAQYQYYWRVEPGTKLFCDVPYDVFDFMEASGKKYGFAISMFEYSKTVPSLWDTFTEYLSTYNVSDNGLLRFVLDDVGGYNMCHFWSNFEVASLEVFDARYDQLFEHLDRSGGFFYERWGDAPVHTLAVAAFLAPDQVHWFDDIGYHHLPYTLCPQNEMWRTRRCLCEPASDFTWLFLSCTPYFQEVQSTSLGSGTIG